MFPCRVFDGFKRKREKVAHTREAMYNEAGGDRKLIPGARQERKKAALRRPKRQVFLMQILLIVLSVAALFILGVIFSHLAEKKKTIERLKNGYGKIPDRKYDEYAMDSIAALWDETQKEPGPFRVDDITWRDLNMDAVFRRLNSACSSVGEETLYAALRGVYAGAESENLEKLEEAVRFFSENPEERLRVQLLLSRIGRMSSNGMIGFFMRPKDKTLPHAFLYPLLCAAAVCSLLSLFVLGVSGFFLIAVVAALNILVYYRSKLAVESELATLRTVASLIACAGKLAGIRKGFLEQYAGRLAALQKPLRKIGRLASSVMGNPSSSTDFITEYVRMFFMLDFLAYNRMVAAVAAHRENCLALYSAVGFLDMAIAVASFRAGIKRFCAPEFTESGELTAEGLVHPLLRDAVPNSVVLRRNAIVTGSNASGKSTFIKALAVNAILAQTIHTCTAEKMAFTPSLVVTSMAVSDSLESGESYYIAEIKSLRRVLDRLAEGRRCLCFIDEILKGTNTVERIAASAAVMSYLQGKSCIAVIATHDIELTEIVGGEFDNFHFQEQVDDSGVRFDYAIRPGRATTTNAIRLLQTLNFPPEVTGNASSLAAGFTKNRRWPVLGGENPLG